MIVQKKKTVYLIEIIFAKLQETHYIRVVCSRCYGLYAEDRQYRARMTFSASGPLACFEAKHVLMFGGISIAFLNLSDMINTLQNS